MVTWTIGQMVSGPRPPDLRGSRVWTTGGDVTDDNVFIDETIHHDNVSDHFNFPPTRERWTDPAPSQDLPPQSVDPPPSPTILIVQIADEQDWVSTVHCPMSICPICPL